MQAMVTMVTLTAGTRIRTRMMVATARTLSAATGMAMHTRTSTVPAIARRQAAATAMPTLLSPRRSILVRSEMHACGGMQRGLMYVVRVGVLMCVLPVLHMVHAKSGSSIRTSLLLLGCTLCKTRPPELYPFRITHAFCPLAPGPELAPGHRVSRR